VTNVGLSVPAFLSVSGSPVTTEGTFAISYSGTSLPIANGGTNNTSAYTSGSILFSNGTSLTQDNSNLFWDNTNKVVDIGSAASYQVTNNLHYPSIQIHSADFSKANLSAFSWGSLGVNASQLIVAHSKSGTVGTHSALASGDKIGYIDFQGSDGSKFQHSSNITGEVDGSVGSAIVPGRLVFNTVNSSGALVERLRISSTGALGLAGSNYGTSGQVLSSTGSASAPVWITPSAIVTLFTGSNTVPDAVTRYFAAGTVETASSGYPQILPIAGTITAMTCQAAIASAGTRVYTLYRSTTALSITCTSSGATTQCSDYAHTSNTTAGDYVMIGLTTSGGATTSAHNCTLSINRTN
jgi:hypothetical protein